MIRIFKITMFLAILLTAAACLYGQDSTDRQSSTSGIKIESAVDRAEIYIGDLITYRLTIIYDSNIILSPPPIGANLGAFDVRDYETDDESKLEDGRIKLESRFLLTTFTTGDYIIPPIPVQYMTADSTKKILVSEPVPIKVKSLLAEAADTADIRDIKAIFEFQSKIPLWYYIVGGLLFLALVGGAILWWKKSRRLVPEGPIDSRPAWEIASERLAILKEKDYLVAGEIKLFYVELSEIIRWFLSRMYDIPVLDMTTYEFLSEIALQDIDEELNKRLTDFLQFADLVKFAKHIPESNKIVSDFDEATAIIDFVRLIEMNRVVVSSMDSTTENKEVENV